MKKIIYILFALVSLLSCEELKQFQSDVKELQDRVDNIESQLSALQNAYDEGKIIKEVLPYSDGDNTGWVITFSDDSSITLYDPEDGVTPIVTINSDGYWTVSYDNGKTFSLIVDGDGNPIMSKGETGHEGKSVRFVVADDGTYCIETYYESAPETVLESFPTTISSDPSDNIVSIVKDPYTGVITLVMADGSEYIFNLDVTYPTSIVVLAQSVVLPKNGVSSFAFRVNPSNAIVDLNVSHDNPMFELDMVLGNMTRSYVNLSENYILDRIEQDIDADGDIKEGQYIAYIKDMGVASDYCEGASVVINTKDGRGNEIQISSDIFQIKTPDKPQFTTFSINGSYAKDLESEFISVMLPYGTDVSALRPSFILSEGEASIDGVKAQSYDIVDFSSPVEYVIKTEEGKEYRYVVSIAYSNIPVVYINTKDGAPIVSKEDWLKGTEIYVTNAGNENRLYSEAQIRGRGNTTWRYPKKPYAIKLDSKEEVLGMPKHKRWVLLANYVDKTCIRNSIAFEIARRSSGLDWTPRGQHVDVIINGKFLGNYFLCEQIKGDKNRVNIKEMESADIDSENITGGYLLEIDKYFDEVNKFRSPIRDMPFMIKEPDEDVLTSEQFTYIQNYVTEIENALYGEGSTTEGYLKYIDLDSFIDYWLVYELTSTGEPTHPKSVYMHKDRAGKMHAGPVWDFDYFTFQPFYNTRLINTNAVWNDRIINDPMNRSAIKSRWEESREGYRTIVEEIDRQFASIRESAEYNSKLWPLDMNVNRDDALSVEDAVARIKEYYITHFEYMDSYFSTF